MDIGKFIHPELQGSTEFAPQFVTPEVTEMLGRWRLLCADDPKAYFTTLNAVIELDGENSHVLHTLLANPDLNLDDTSLATAELSGTEEHFANAYHAVLSDATGIGRYLLDHEEPGQPETFNNFVSKKYGRLGRTVVKAITGLEKRNRSTLDELERVHGVDIDELFEVTTDVAWQYTDAFEANAACLAVVKLSGLSRNAKDKLKLYKDFNRWQKEYGAINAADTDTQLEIRGEFFQRIMKRLVDISRQAKYADEPIIGDIVTLVNQYTSAREIFDEKIALLVETIDQYEHQGVENDVTSLNAVSPVVSDDSEVEVAPTSDQPPAEPSLLAENEEVVIQPQESFEATDTVEEEMPEMLNEHIQAREIEVFSQQLESIALQLTWEVLPPAADINQVREEIEKHYTKDELKGIDWVRIEALVSLQQEVGGEIYRSKHRSLGTKQPYFVLRFDRTDHVYAVAEHPQYGNATYILREDLTPGTWQEILELPKKTARELGANQIIHSTPELHLERITRALHSLYTVK